MNKKQQRSADRRGIWQLAQVLARVESSKLMRPYRAARELAECTVIVELHANELSQRHQDFVNLVRRRLTAAARGTR